ncbi:MAG: pyrroline-5-carboxylate reductase [Phycisphaeraceae bacterium]|nr:pyrroline-5-carboxylate reductase [Phycisphaeraceae bacterium]
MTTQRTSEKCRPALFIGGGNMAAAIVRSGLRSGVLAAPSTIVAEPEESRRAELSMLGIIAVPDATRGIESMLLIETAHHCHGMGAVVLAVKPQVLGTVASTTPSLGSLGPRCFVSIMAGVTSARLAASLPAPHGGSHRFVRVMPNLPISVGKGMTAIAQSASIDAHDRDWTESLFASGGDTVVLPEELIDAFTAVAGSGPAYVFYIAEAMERAAQSVGFDAKTARAIVRQTINGAASLLSDANTDPSALRQAVTSKGGTTHAACSVLDSSGVMEAFARAIVAARDRGRELSSG